MNRIAKITFEPPTDLRDFVWAPANVTWANGGEAIALIPVRYPGSESSEDGATQLARVTNWQEPAEGLFLGEGQRLLTSDVDDYGILDARMIEFDVDPEEVAAEQPEG